MKIQYREVLLLLLLVFQAKFAFAQNADKEVASNVDKNKAKIEETVLGMNVSGNKEAPNILYIIPWKANADDSTPPEVNRLMDEIFSTVDPDVYQKEVDFFEQLTVDNAVSDKIEKK